MMSSENTEVIYQKILEMSEEMMGQERVDYLIGYIDIVSNILQKLKTASSQYKIQLCASEIDGVIIRMTHIGITFKQYQFRDTEE